VLSSDLVDGLGAAEIQGWHLFAVPKESVVPIYSREGALSIRIMGGFPHDEAFYGKNTTPEGQAVKISFVRWDLVFSGLVGKL